VNTKSIFESPKLSLRRSKCRFQNGEEISNMQESVSLNYDNSRSFRRRAEQKTCSSRNGKASAIKGVDWRRANDKVIRRRKRTWQSANRQIGQGEGNGKNPRCPMIKRYVSRAKGRKSRRRNTSRKRHRDVLPSTDNVRQADVARTKVGRTQKNP